MNDEKKYTEEDIRLAFGAGFKKATDEGIAKGTWWCIPNIERIWFDEWKKEHNAR